jgi:hypothetical protein
MHRSEAGRNVGPMQTGQVMLTGHSYAHYKTFRNVGFADSLITLQRVEGELTGPLRDGPAIGLEQKGAIVT